ncbi:MAG: cytochrome c biogenesis protein CcdA, partial [Nocardioides sp.]
ATAGGAGQWLRTYQDEITVVMGYLLIVLGLVFAGALPWLQREWRIHTIPSVGLGAAPVVGAIFALGWTPCVGPTFGVTLTLTYASDDATATRGAVLAGAYALGLGVPFIVAALFYTRTLGALRWVRSHQQAVMRIGGGMLIVVGLLLVTGVWDDAVQWVQLRLVDNFEVAV